MPRLANDCLSQVERGALEEQLRCDNCVLGKTEDWGPWYLKPAIRKENGRHRGARGADAALRGARCCSTCSCSKHTVPARAPLLPPA
jgi:hypothetical protein